MSQKKFVSPSGEFYTADILVSLKANEGEEIKVSDTICTYYIQLIPGAGILNRGVNLQSIIDGFSEIGQIKVLDYFNEDIPQNKELYDMQWEIYVATKEPIDEIQDYLIF